MIDEKKLLGPETPPPRGCRCSRREFLQQVKGFVLATAAYEIISLLPFLSGCGSKEDHGEKGVSAPSPRQAPKSEQETHREDLKPEPPEKEQTAGPSAAKPAAPPAKSSARPLPEQPAPAKDSASSETPKPAEKPRSTCTACIGCTGCTKACTVSYTCWVEYTALHPECPACIGCTRCTTCVQTCTIGCTA
uniref:hypothetical protein n=1 Tax=Thermodesulfitimonas autotrophica TaxID=1894989 RepID=UPI002FE1089D